MQKFYLVWDDSRHILGIASIDRQHRELVDRVNELAEAVEHGHDFDQLRQRMEGIFDFTRQHFSHEEALMREHGFPGMEQHAAEHAELLSKAATLMQSLNPDKPIRVMLITAFLTDCVERHIQQEDVALVQHLLGKGLS